MLNYATIQNVIQNLRMVFDIALMWILIYYIMKIVRNNSRTIQIFKGIIFVLVVKSLSTFFGFKTVEWLSEMFIQWGFLAVIIIFQPEIRSLLEKLGKSSVFTRISTLSGNEKEQLVDELVLASTQLSEDKIGALITIEQSQSLIDYIRTGSPMNSIVTSDVLRSIFSTSTPIHDGAVIIQGDRISCASAYFPPTNLELPSRYGARHRAALGISEITDSITIVVSEETGKISIAEQGSLLPMTEEKLRTYLNKMIIEEEVDVQVKKDNNKRHFFNSRNPVEVVAEDALPKKTTRKTTVKTKKSIKDLFNKITKAEIKDKSDISLPKTQESKTITKETENESFIFTDEDVFDDVVEVDKIEAITSSIKDGQEIHEYLADDQPIEVEKIETWTTATKDDNQDVDPFESFLSDDSDDKKSEGGES